MPPFLLTPTMAVLAGLEPTTRCLEGSCSVQMSYRTNGGIIPKIPESGKPGHPGLSRFTCFYAAAPSCAYHIYAWTFFCGVFS